MSPFVILGVFAVILWLFFFDGKILLANNIDPGQTSHYVASDLGLHSWPLSFYGFPSKNGLKERI